MSQSQRKYDSTVARIAGNVAAGLVGKPDRRCSALAESSEEIAEWAQSIILLSVGIARGIVADVERTEPAGVTRQEQGK